MIIGGDGPAVVLSARGCAWLERYARLASLRTMVRGVDPEMSALLEEIRRASEAWRGSVIGTEVARPSEPASESSQWLSTTEVGAVLRVGPRAVVKAIDRGSLPATRIGRTWSINREDLEHYRATRRQQ